MEENHSTNEWFHWEEASNTEVRFSSRPRIVAAIYGLKQAPRAWFNKFSDFLLAFGFICSLRDPSLFIYKKNGDIILLLLYVDDIALTGSNKALIGTLLDALNREFKMKDLGQFHYFLGLQASFTANGMFLNQEKYAEDLLHISGMSGCTPVATPLPLQLNRVPDTSPLFPVHACLTSSCLISH